MPETTTERPQEKTSGGEPDAEPQSPGNEIDRSKSLVVLTANGNGATSDSWFSRILARLGLRSAGSLRDDLADALSSEDAASSVFSPEERAMLHNILRLREVRVEDVMVPRGNVEAVDREITLAELLQIFEENGHSRMPVYNESLDDPRGMVLIKDLLLYITREAAKQGKGGKAAKTRAKWKPASLDLGNVDLQVTLHSVKIMRQVLFVPPSMLASDLMARMQATRTQMALVIDEYGGTDGLVSLEDIVEEVVGEIEDEHDDDPDVMMARKGDGLWQADARVELDVVAEHIGESFDPGDLGEEVDTLGGLVFSLAGHIPVRGEVVTGLRGFEFRVTDADPRRVKRLEIVQTGLRNRRKTQAKNAPQETPAAPAP